MESFSDRDRLGNGHLKHRFQFSNSRMDCIFNNFGDVEDIECNAMTLTKEVPPFAFSRLDCPFTPKNEFKFTIDNEEFRSVEDYMTKMMFRELVGTDPPTKESCWALNLIERNVSTQDWEKWQLRNGLLHMQKALLERAKSDKQFRAQINVIHNRFVVYSYRNDVFYGSECSREEVQEWFKMMAASRMAIRFPKGFPINYKQLHCVPRIARKGYNVLGVILMALRDTMKFTPLDDITVELPEVNIAERPLSFSTRLTTQKRIHGTASTCGGSVSGSRMSLFSSRTDASQFKAANSLFDATADNDHNKRLRYDPTMFRRMDREGTPCTLMGDMDIERLSSPCRSRRASSVASEMSMEFETRRLVQITRPPSANNNINFDQVDKEGNGLATDDDDEIQFLGELDKNVLNDDTRHKMSDQGDNIEQKPDIAELKHTPEPRVSCLFKFPDVFNTTGKANRGRESANSMDSGFATTRSNMGSSSTLNGSFPAGSDVFRPSRSDGGMCGTENTSPGFGRPRLSVSSEPSNVREDPEQLLPATSEGLPVVTDADALLLDDFLEQKPKISRPSRKGHVLDTINLE